MAPKFRSSCACGPRNSACLCLRLPLALRAEERRPVHEDRPLDGPPAPRARLTFAPVSVEPPVEIAGLAVHIDVERVETGATGRNRLAEHLFDVSQQPLRG